ncbi:MAG TPA: phosphoribosyl-ATP diphosphatase [Candidatus Sulfotelmatobacter sp.]|nr:phosphoribosyl-ATP diphosphatase [Candidatus Sulfotelmatobacter sp.]
MICEELYKIIEDRKKNMPKGSYIASLFRGGNDRIIQKIGEEATEVVIAAKNESKERIIFEVADLLFHILVLLSAKDIEPKEIMQELKIRDSRK